MAYDQARNSEIVELTQRVCEQLSIAFSANDANQSLADMGGAIGDSTDSELFEAIGRRVGVRFREIQSNFKDLALAAFEATPLLVERAPRQHEDAPGYFVVLKRKSRSRFLVYIDGREETVSRSWLKKNAVRSEEGTYHWYMAQPMFAAEAASAYNYQTGTYDKPLTPLKRWLAFLRPEARDARIILLFSVFVGILSLTTPLAVEALVNTIAFGRYLQPLIVLAIIVFVFLAFRAGLNVLMTIIVETIQRRMFARVVDDLSFRLTRVPMAYLKKKHGPELVNRFLDIAHVQKITAKLLLESLMLALQTVIGLTVLAFYHPFLLGYDVGLLTMMTVVLFILGRGAVKTAKDESAYKYETAAWLQEIVRHPTTFKFNGGLGFAINRADELVAKYIQSRTAHFRILIRQVTFSMLMQAVAATVLLGLGGYLVIEDQLTLGQLVAAELIVTLILGSLAKVGKELESYYDLMASVDKLGKLFDLPGEPAGKLQLAQQDGASEIELVDLKFLKSGASPVTSAIQPGVSAAITGPSGSGKTKVIETIAGLHSPVDGYVLLNNFRVDLIGAESLQSRVGFINNIEIFDGTIDENLRLGRQEIDSTAISEIIEKMGMHKTITGLEDGFETQLSVTGFPLSSGQSIRLVLARALIARPGALLIDSLLDRLADDDLEDLLPRLDQFKANTTIICATGRKAIADWSDMRVAIQ